MTSAEASSSQAKTKNAHVQAPKGHSAETEQTQEKRKREATTEEITMQSRLDELSQVGIRVLIVDDHEVVRKGLYAALSEEKDFVVVGEADNGHTALVRTQELQPDIVLLDIFLGTTNGLDIVQQLQRASPTSRIAVLTGLTDEELLLQAMRIGVCGYLQKSLPLAELLSALRAIHRGERVIGEQRAITQVLSEFHRLTREQSRTRSGLSELEIELVRLAAQGCSNREIAARQFWSEVTVKRKMQDIYRKLQVTDRAQAVAEAIRTGLI
jgi:DNA-binding NarL/FixJ family response regulator